MISIINQSLLYAPFTNGSLYHTFSAFASLAKFVSDSTTCYRSHLRSGKCISAVRENTYAVEKQICAVEKWICAVEKWIFAVEKYICAEEK